jgi:hypothetical protein
VVALAKMTLVALKKQQQARSTIKETDSLATCHEAWKPFDLLTAISRSNIVSKIYALSYLAIHKLNTPPFLLSVTCHQVGALSGSC